MAAVCQPAAGARGARAWARKSWPAIFLVNAVSLACLVWAARGSRFGEIWPEVGHMEWRLAAGAVLCDMLAYTTHAWRWKLLLTPLRRVSLLQAGRAIYASLFVNEILPFRPGEAVRCLLLSRSTGLPVSLVCASAVIERMFDGLWAVIGLIFCGYLRAAPEPFRRTGYMVAGAMVVASVGVGAALLFLAMAGKLRRAPGFVMRAAWVRTLLYDLEQIGHSAYLYYSFLASGVYLLAQFLPIYLLVRADRVPVPWTASVALIVFIRLGSALPQALGNMGAFQAVTSQTLLSFGAAADRAKRFSFVLWGMVNLPLLCIGFAAALFEGVDLMAARRDPGRSRRKLPPLSKIFRAV